VNPKNFGNALNATLKADRLKAVVLNLAHGSKKTDNKLQE
jgi:hypothetical protein